MCHEFRSTAPSGYARWSLEFASFRHALTTSSPSLAHRTPLWNFKERPAHCITVGISACAKNGNNLCIRILLVLHVRISDRFAHSIINEGRDYADHTGARGMLEAGNGSWL